MLEKTLFISLFTLIIHTADTLSYSVRLAGVRTRRLAVSMSLTGIILLVSRTSNIIQAPLTGALIDAAKKSIDFHLEFHFRLIIAASSFGTLLAMLLFPTFVSLAERVIAHLEIAGSIPNLLRSHLTIRKVKQVKQHVRWPKWEMLSRLRIGGIPKRLLLLNCMVTAIYTVGVLASLYASILVPELAMTAAMSSGLINGFATIIFILLVDPQVALLTDKAIDGRIKKSQVNKVFGLLMMSRFCGTLLAQFIFIPAAYWVAWITPFIA